MRSARSLLGLGMAIACGGSSIACNSIVGFNFKAGPDVLDCHIDPDFPHVASDPATARLIHTPSATSSTAPLLTMPLGDSAVLSLELIDQPGGRGVVTTVNTYPLMDVDADIQTCGICTAIEVTFDTPTGTGSEKLRARGQGQLLLTTSDSTRLAGTLQGLVFRLVTEKANMTTDVEHGCTVTLEDVQFDLMYATP